MASIWVERTGVAMIGASAAMALIFVGCDKNGEIELDTAIGTVDDSSITDTLETGTVDTSVTVQDPIASFVLGEVTAGATLSLTWIDPTGDSLEYGETAYSSSAQSGTMGVYLPDPLPADMISINESVGWELAFYVPALHDDSNGDGIISLFETIYGVGEYWLFFSNISVPDLGVDYGWNALMVGVDQFVGPFEVPLGENLQPTDTISISGLVTSEEDNIIEARLAAIPVTMFAGLPVADLVYDEALSRNWSLTVEGAPASDHLQNNQDFSASYALEYLAVYSDDNTNYSYDFSDEILTGVCRGDRSASLIYMGVPWDLAGAILYVFQGLTPGWFVMESWTEADGSERNEFLLSPETTVFDIGEPCWSDDG